MKFKNYKNMLERPYYVCADIEAILSPYVDEKANKQEELSAKIIEHYAKQNITVKIRAPTRRVALHKPTAACLYLVCTFDSTKNKLWHYVGEECIINMLKKLHWWCIEVKQEMRHNE